MTHFHDVHVSRTILESYHQRLADRLQSDVLVVGAGPSGLTAAADLADAGRSVTVLEKRLAPGGGVWGGGMAMNVAVVQDAAVGLLQEAGVRHERRPDGLHAVDAVELASAICLKALRAGAAILNLVTAEDLCVRDGRVCGVVANRSMIAGVLPVDPIALSARAVIDGTGHEAVLVGALRRRGLLEESAGEGPMDAPAGEAFVVDRVAQVFPGLWVTGMSVCAAFGGPRMGPIFGGMLLSGRRAAQGVDQALTD